MSPDAANLKPVELPAQARPPSDLLCDRFLFKLKQNGLWYANQKRQFTLPALDAAAAAIKAHGSCQAVKKE